MPPTWHSRSATTLGPLYEQLTRQSVLSVKAEQIATFLTHGIFRFPGVPSQLSDPGRIWRNLATNGPADAAPRPNTPKAPARR